MAMGIVVVYYYFPAFSRTYKGFAPSGKIHQLFAIICKVYLYFKLLQQLIASALLMQGADIGL
jgi:hypothetical protein